MDPGPHLSVLLGDDLPAPSQDHWGWSTGHVLDLPGALRGRGDGVALLRNQIQTLRRLYFLEE